MRVLHFLLLACLMLLGCSGNPTATTHNGKTLNEWVKILESPKNGDERTTAMHSVAAFGDAAVPALIEVLKEDENIKVLTSAANALGQIGPAAKDAVPALLEVLKKDDRASRSNVLALVQIGPAAVPALIEALKNDENAYVRYTAAEYLGAIGSSEALPALKTASENDTTVLVRNAAARALESIEKSRTGQ